MYVFSRDSTETDTGTVLGRNIVASEQSGEHFFCFGAGPCEAFSLDI